MKQSPLTTATKEDNLDKYKWVLYKLSYRDDKKIWHELHKKNNRLRHVDTKLFTLYPSQNSLTSAFKSQGHNLNFSDKENINYSTSLSLIDTNLHSSINKNTGKSFSKLPRFETTKSIMTYNETLKLKDESNTFISHHTNRRKCNQLLNTINAPLNDVKINNLSSSFLSTQRTELFDLDKIAKEYEFDKTDTESSIFAKNSAYWIRDNIGFKMRKRIKNSKTPDITITKMSQNKNNKDSNNNNQQKKKINQKRKSNINVKVNKQMLLKFNNNQNNTGLKLQHRRLIGSASLSNIFLPSTTIRHRIHSAKSSSPSKSSTRSSNNLLNHQNDSNIINSPVLNIKLRERTPINHHPLKKYSYRNIFDDNNNTKKIFILGSNTTMQPIVN